MQKYIIGIDLGTTNCTMAYTSAYTSLSSAPTNPIIEQFSIPQILKASTQGEHHSLPSFIYYPLPEELSKKFVSLKWNPDPSYTIGTFARDRGSELPTRLISSAKSWLCHNGIDRRHKNLPFELDNIDNDSINKISPLEACAQLLQHLREAWNEKMPKASFNNQQILITVPASFDPSAKELVQEAAAMAQFPEIILLEEPQAAFYSWLHTHHDQWRNELKVGDSILVIDIGGGTTDFSLIMVEDHQGNLSLKRQAVGSHLLLGGDNIDLALAYFAKQKLEDQGHTIDQWQLQSLVHRCRIAKEILMGENPPSSIDITILGRGSKLIGNTLKTEITLEEAHKLILEGFFPLVKSDQKSPPEKRSGIQQIGLPYVQDPRISCQLAKFLSIDDEVVLPSAVLFNGGTLKASAFRQRLLKLLNSWAAERNKSPIKELGKADYDYAVSRGAVYYGLARLGHAVRIKGGTSRSYFVGIEEAALAVPGISPPMRAICIAPFGMEEGEEKSLNDQEFALVVGEHSTFRFLSHESQKLNDGTEPNVGTVIKNWKKELVELNPIETVLEKNDSDGKTVNVRLQSKVTELGMLELWCVASDGRKWKLEFNIRN